jgi:hypothetical protein
MKPRGACPAALGTTLVEAVIALGLLGGLVLAASGLVVLGMRQVGAGGRASSAHAAAVGLLEQLELRSFRRTYEGLDCDGTAASCRVGPGDPAVEPWQTRVAEAVPGARLELRVEAVGASSLDAATLLRIVVEISWHEGPRSRRLRLTTVRV